MKFKTIILLIFILIGSCTITRTPPSTKREAGLYTAHYDLDHKWWRTPIIEVIIDSSESVVITGKKCKFTYGEKLYYKSEYWNGAMEWKCLLVNKDESLKYFIQQ